MNRRLAAGLLLAILAGCAAPPPKPVTPAPAPAPAPHLTLTPSTFAALPGWSDDHVAEALPAFVKSCAAITKLADDARLGVAGTARDWRAPCAAAAQTPASDDDARRFFETWFAPYEAGDNGATDGLFTGYYEGEAHGARQPAGAFATPMLRRPNDLVMVELGQFRPAWHSERIAGRVVNGQLKPYESRAQIEAGALDRDRLAFCWVDDPVDAFFIEIQGSGRIHLDDGTTVRVQYDGQNGWPYVAIGHRLVERGELTTETASMASIRAWIKAHPADGKVLMDENPSYVFFRELKGDGPIGSGGVVLTPGRSLAVDRDFVPLGVPVWLDAAQDGQSLRRLAIAQDTGGAIRGPVRGDVFWGYGPDAERQAGSQRARGAYYLLLPRGVAVAAN